MILHIAEDDTIERFMSPWETLDNSADQFGLVYETKYMTELGTAMDIVYNMALSMCATEALKMTVLQGIDPENKKTIRQEITNTSKIRSFGCCGLAELLNYPDQGN